MGGLLRGFLGEGNTANYQSAVAAFGETMTVAEVAAGVP